MPDSNKKLSYRQGTARRAVTVKIVLIKVAQIYVRRIAFDKSCIGRMTFNVIQGQRLRGDMIEVFKITHNIYGPDVSLKLEYNSGCSTSGVAVTSINFLVHILS